MTNEKEGESPEPQKEPIESKDSQEDPSKYSKSIAGLNSDAKWINNQGELVEKVFGFNDNAELVNGRAAMFGFIMLIITELVFKGEPATRSLFGIG